MKRWLPAPLLSAGLFTFWLLLQQSVAPAHLLLGALIAIAVPRLTAPLRVAGGRVRHPLRLLRLIGHVGGDVVRSGLGVGAGVLKASRHPPRGRFVVVPLELRDPHALAALAMITAVVPGTVWCELALDRSALLLHVFDVADDAAFIAHYKSRYERPLVEIFE
ncbi:Na+/H+ antiporter subunit E [Piscinibacter koreensis]|uniref:Na+/H+ antiporter subunit E n=1 Tax=Piscinibacter koreensis TaxID=2742824 RepID=A0A7Y6NQ60_9BURK|nr:Na+/H+ antiporter subunit E [Schlegelella koreensis]NUZ07315.1 Na+/H+ antiporter subunit E [Schlegelella koreensis]